MKVALVHDWLTGMRGGEKVLELLCERYPDADIFTLFHVRGSVSPTIERHRIVTSALQKLPFAKTHYRKYLPLYPTAIEQFDLDPYDVSSIVEGMRRVLSDSALANELRRKGLIRARDFSWERSVARTHEIYQLVGGRH